MKRLLAIAALAALPLWAAKTILAIPNGGSVTVPLGGRLAYVRMLSTVGSGTCALKCAQELHTNETSIVSHSLTNVTYSLVYMDGSTTVTNVTEVDQSAGLAGLSYVSYTTNNVITTWSETNTVDAVALTVTNSLVSITCSGGAGIATPTNTYLLAGDRLFFEGTAKGRAHVIIER